MAFFDGLLSGVKEAVADRLLDGMDDDVANQMRSGGGPRAGSKAPSASLGEVPLKGMRKSLLIGVNYKGQSGELRGCINDVQLIRQCLTKQGFPTDSGHQLVLIEEGGFNPPTRQNIMQGLSWLVSGAKPGDSLFLHYSGHGTRVKDQDGDETDGYDEAIVPLDHERTSLILDDELHDIIVKPLPRGCRLTAVMDCCHSGSALDLPFCFTATEAACATWRDLLPQMIASKKWERGNFKENLRQLAVQGAVVAAHQRLTGGVAPGGGDGDGTVGAVQVTQKFAEGEVIMFSGCKDTQTSADVYDASSFKLPTSGAGGACTHALVSVLASKPRSPFIEVLDAMREMLKEKGFKQVPQLSSTVDIPLNAPFYLVE